MSLENNLGRSCIATVVITLQLSNKTMSSWLKLVFFNFNVFTISKDFILLINGGN